MWWRYKGKKMKPITLGAHRGPRALRAALPDERPTGAPRPRSQQHRQLSKLRTYEQEVASFQIYFVVALRDRCQHLIENCHLGTSSRNQPVGSPTPTWGTPC